MALLTLIICIFDLATDWYTFVAFFRFRSVAIDDQLTIALGVASGIGSIVFFLELRNGVAAYRMYSRSRDDLGDGESSLVRWQEVITFLQVIAEDTPVAVVMYMTFRYGSCKLFLHIFEETIIGNLALMGAFVSACWKFMTSLCYCCLGHCIGHKEDCGWACCCCCCRAFRSVVSVTLLGFTAYLYFTFNYKGIETRDDCVVL